MFGVVNGWYFRISSVGRTRGHFEQTSGRSVGRTSGVFRKRTLRFKQECENHICTIGNQSCSLGVKQPPPSRSSGGTLLVFKWEKMFPQDNTIDLYLSCKTTDKGRHKIRTKPSIGPNGM